MPEYKLTYFNGRGTAEPIRLVFAYADTPYEDVRLESKEWTPEKKAELGLEWGQVPMLEIDGEKKFQSFAILRFLARKFKLAGDNEDEEIKTDELIEAVRDYIKKTEPMWGSVFGPDGSKLEEQKKKFAEVDSPPMLARFENLLEKKGNTWLVGNRLSYADIVFVNYVTQFEVAFELQLVKDFPAIQKLIAAVRNEPKIKEWIEKRPNTPY